MSPEICSNCGQQHPGWTCPGSLHNRLIENQSDEELRRKARKAYTPKYWTQEEIDHIERQASRLSKIMWE